MNRPRNPIHFPAMKIRGARRGTLAPFQRVARAFNGLGIEAKKAAALLEDMNEAWGNTVDTNAIKESK